MISVLKYYYYKLIIKFQDNELIVNYLMIQNIDFIFYKINTLKNNTIQI